MFVPPLPPSAHQRGCREEAKQGFVNRESETVLPSFGVGGAVLGWGPLPLAKRLSGLHF